MGTIGGPRASGPLILCPLCPGALCRAHVRTNEYVAAAHFPAASSRVRTKPPARVLASCVSSLECRGVATSHRRRCPWFDSRPRPWFDSHERRRPLKSVGQCRKYTLEFNGTAGQGGTGPAFDIFR